MVDKWPERILAATVFIAVCGVVLSLIVSSESTTLSAAGLAALSALLTLIVTSIFQSRKDDRDEGDDE